MSLELEDIESTPTFLRMVSPNSITLMSDFSALVSMRRQPKIEYGIVVMAVTGVAVMISGYLISPLLVERDRAIFESLSPDDPNWLFYRDLGDAILVYAYSLFAGSILVILSVIVSIVYYFMRRGLSYKLKRNLDRLKLKGSNVA